jgi:serine/threonine protein kinase
MAAPDNENQLEGMDKGPAFLLHKEGFSIDDYKLIERIGEGTFGEVWKAERSGFPVALKILKTTVNSEETQRELESLEKLKKLHHKYLLHTQNFWSDGDRLFIEMELADGGSLKERLKAYRDLGKNAIPEDELLKYFTEIGKALDYMHGHRPVFLHRDIKPANILLVQGSAKLADFGLLRQVSGDNSSTKTQGGTFPYMAPESIKDDRFSVNTDLFAFAVTYAELRQGSLPFPGNNQFQICQKILDDPPKLSDIFDPEERKVVLRALSKDPNERFPSCGEFVFELNRVVPWLPATTIKALPTPPKPEPAVPVSKPGTTAKQPRQIEHGTSPRNSPTTMESVDLPPHEVSPGASTVANRAGTVVNSTGARSAKATIGDSAKKPAATQVKPTAPATVKPKPLPAPAPEPVSPPISKVPARMFVTALLLAVLVCGGTAIWFLMSRDPSEGVRKLIGEKKFAEAAKKLESATGIDSAPREELWKEIETQWWREFPALVETDLDPLTKRKNEVQEFLGHFRNHAEANQRLAAIDEKIGEIGAINNKSEEFDDLLARAKRKFDKQNLIECLTDLKAAKAHARSNPQKQKLSNEFRVLRDRVLELYASKTPTKAKVGEFLEARGKLDVFLSERDLHWTDDIRDKLDADKSLALAFLKETTDSFDIYVRLLDNRNNPLAMNSLLQQHTAWYIEHVGLLSPERVSTTGVNNQPPKELYLLNRLAAAHGTDSDKQREAVGALIGLMNEAPPPAVTKAMWPALAKIDHLIRFENLAGLNQVLPPEPTDDETRKAVSLILGGVLKRKVEHDKFAWRAGPKEQQERCLAWIARIEKPVPQSLLALKAECLVETGRGVNGLGANYFPLPEAGWYGSYVHALVLEREGKLPGAANVIAENLAGKRNDLKPRERVDKSLKILRGAVHWLQDPKTKRFKNETEAKDAIRWLTVVVEFTDQAKDAKDGEAIDDAVALAFAAVKVGDTKRLGEAEARLKAAGSDMGYYWLAKAFDAEGKSQAKVRTYLEKMHDVKPADPDAAQKAAVADGGQLALKMAQVYFNNSKWDEAIAASQLGEKLAYRARKWDLPAAAKLLGSAVKVEAESAGQKASGKDSEVYAGACYSVYEKAIKKAFDDNDEPTDGFHVPVVIECLDLAFQYRGTNSIKGQLSAVEKKGGTALMWADRFIKEANPKEKENWQELKHKGMGKLAEVRVFLLGPLIKLKSEREKNQKEIRTLCEKLREGYLAVREMKKDEEKFPGELSYLIGTMFWQTCDLPGGNGKAEAATAEKEFIESLKRMDEAAKNPEYRELKIAKDAREKIAEMRADSAYMKLLGK